MVRRAHPTAEYHAPMLAAVDRFSSRLTSSTIPRRARSVIVVVLALALAACGGKHAQRGSEEHAASAATSPTRGYVVVSIDTLRADHLGCYGYPRATSPFIDELARRGTLF